uniref:NADH dehydrogenase [ubiquinone] 1 subunit C2 n=1 Tax=Sphenodon punctatus TaxID=8508 RepID=A0A8D0H3I9_SPHPU
MWIRGPPFGPFLPDESRSLPPPALFNRGSVSFALMGWMSTLLDNGIRNRPAFRTGVHRQVLWTTIVFYVGYWLCKRSEYVIARRSTDTSWYIKEHPEDFPEKEKKTYAEILEKFYPIR